MSKSDRIFPSESAILQILLILSLGTRPVTHPARGEASDRISRIDQISSLEIPHPANPVDPVPKNGRYAFGVVSRGWLSLGFIDALAGRDRFLVSPLVTTRYA
jgi:hypothetical protein